MRLLFDQNISYRIISKISDIFPESKQVKELGLDGYSDRDIWNFARDHGYAIVTFDADFFDLANILGNPPKTIWLRTGNRKTNELALLIRSKSEIIIEFLMNPTYKEIDCLEIVR